MSLAENKEIVRRFCQAAWVEQNITLCDELIAPTYLHYSPPNFTTQQRWNDERHMLRKEHTQWHSVRLEILDILAEGDRVVVRLLFNGISAGRSSGRRFSLWQQEIFPSAGTAVTVASIMIFRLADGKIVERWDGPDVMGVLLQSLTVRRLVQLGIAALVWRRTRRRIGQ